MKKIVKIFAVLTIFNIAFSSCKQDQYDIAKQNVAVTHSADGPIAQAESKLGTLEKRDVTFKDEAGTSTFTVRIAAKNQQLIEDYLTVTNLKFITYRGFRHILGKLPTKTTYYFHYQYITSQKIEFRQNPILEHFLKHRPINRILPES